jgi:hypothetical protein
LTVKGGVKETHDREGRPWDWGGVSPPQADTRPVGPGNPPTLRGEDSNLSRLTERDVTVMRNRMVAGADLQALADEYGVTRQAVWMAVTGRTWAKLPGAIEHDKSTGRWLTRRSA